MGKTSNKHIRFLIVTLISIFLLSLSVSLFMRFSHFGGSVRVVRSGTFINMKQDVGSDGWHFFAEEANGHITFFVNLDQHSLDNFSFESGISDGEMSMLITQGDLTQIFDLSEIIRIISPEDIAMSMFKPGRIEMRLNLVNAKAATVIVGWQ